MKRRRIAHGVFDQESGKGIAELGVALELNASPNRLDLRDDHLRLARDLGCRFVINTDSHRIPELDLMRYGIDDIRWLQSGDLRFLQQF